MQGVATRGSAAVSACGSLTFCASDLQTGCSGKPGEMFHASLADGSWTTPAVFVRYGTSDSVSFRLGTRWEKVAEATHSQAR